MDLGGWLRSLGLEKYEAVLRDSEIDEAVLHNLTEDHLREPAWCSAQAPKCHCRARRDPSVKRYGHYRGHASAVGCGGDGGPVGKDKS